MAFQKVCKLDDLWQGEMDSFEVGGKDILLLSTEEGVKAFQGVCPHQDIPLVEGKFDGKTLICRAHLWQFDVSSGKGVNPKDCELAAYPVMIDGEDVLVDVEGIEPIFSHT